jgi:5'-methylthioadenosine phosphorylase
LTPARARIGLVGGSGVYDLAAIEDLREESLETPFGRPSDAYFTGTLGGVPVAFLSRHGRGHRLSPTEINYRANVCGFKMLGCDAILSASACGSLREELAPRHAVIPDQFIDRTRHRADTFFEDGIVAHASLADPVCPDLSGALEQGARSGNLTVHRGGTYVCMEGPQFSTLAESKLYRSWGMDVIGMTNLQEAKLAREAEMCYVTLALVTDYDCWHPDHDSVTVEMIVQTLMQNAKTAQQAIAGAIATLPATRSCECGSALKYALITRPEVVPAQLKRDLAPIIGRYLS